MGFQDKKIRQYEDGAYRLVTENPDGSGTFIYKGATVILKRCKNGYWKDPETGECVPKEQLQGTSQPSKPKTEPKAQQPKAEAPKKEPKEPKSDRPTERPKAEDVKSRLQDSIPKKYHKYLQGVQDTERGIRVDFGMNRDTHRNANRSTYAEMKQAIVSMFREQGYEVDDSNWGSVYINTDEGVKAYETERDKRSAEERAERDAKEQERRKKFEEIESSKSEEDKAMDRWGVNSFLDSLDSTEDFEVVKLDSPMEVSARFVSEVWDEDEYNDLRSDEDKIPPAPHLKYFDRSKEESSRGYGYKKGTAKIPADAYVVYSYYSDSLYFYDKKKKAWGRVSNASDYIDV